MIWPKAIKTQTYSVVKLTEHNIMTVAKHLQDEESRGIRNVSVSPDMQTLYYTSENSTRVEVRIDDWLIDRGEHYFPRLDHLLESEFEDQYQIIE